MRCGRKPQDQQLRLCISEARNRLAPVRPLAVRPPFFPRHLFAMTHQPGAPTAADNFFVQETKL
jgi:hypothetical protein